MIANSRMFSKELYSRIIDETLRPFLLQHGFRPKGRGVFVRWNGDCLHRIACDFRKDRGVDRGWMLVTVCVGFKSLAELLEPSAEVNRVNVRLPCAMATDLGHLIPPFFRYLEHEITPITDWKTEGENVAKLLEVHGLKYFEDFGDLEHALAAWEKGINFNLGSTADFYIAAAYWRRGERDRAIAFLRQTIAVYEERRRGRYNPSALSEKMSRERFLAYLVDTAPRFSSDDDQPLTNH